MRAADPARRGRGCRRTPCRAGARCCRPATRCRSCAGSALRASRGCWIERVEVEQAQPFAGRRDGIAVVVLGDRALGQIGDADVVARMPQGGGLEEGAPDVHPLLVDEQPGQRVVEALGAQMAPPPVEERAPARRSTPQNPRLCTPTRSMWPSPISASGDGACRKCGVRRMPPAEASSAGPSSAMRGGHVRVGVEIEDLLGFPQQGLQQERLDARWRTPRGRTTSPAPARCGAADRATSVLRQSTPGDLGERVARRAWSMNRMRSRRAVLVLSQALGECEGLGQVVGGEDGAVGARRHEVRWVVPGVRSRPHLGNGQEGAGIRAPAASARSVR